MNVLIFYGMPNPDNTNKRIHYGVLQNLSKFCNSKMLITAKGEVGNIRDELKNHDTDVVLMYNTRVPGKSRVDIPFTSFKKDGKEKKFKKIYAELDHDTEKVKKYCDQNNGFDVCIQRGSFSCDGMPCPTVWLPFSADENSFVPKPMSERKNVVGISATISSKPYKQRRRMIEILKKEKIMKVCSSGKCKKDGYPDFIASVTVGLTSTDWSRYGITTSTPHAKMWEYMASKTVVLTPPFVGMHEIFGENYNDYICVCREDLTDLKAKAKNLLEDEKERKRLTENAYDLFLKEHTDIKRSEELFNIIQAVYRKEEIPRKWKI